MRSVAPEALLYCMLLGVGLGLLFTVLEWIRMVLGLGKILTCLLDILFCTAAAGASFILSLAVSAGRMRFFQLGGEILGFLCVQLTLTYGLKRFLPRILRRISQCRERVGKRVAALREKRLRKKAQRKKKLVKKRIISDSVEKNEKKT